MQERKDAGAQDDGARERSAAIEREILRESLLHRADGARVAMVGLVVSIVPFYLVLSGRVPEANLAMWMLPMPVLVALRQWIGARVRRLLDDEDESTMRRYDKLYRANSVMVQLQVGSGMWIVAGRGLEVDLIVTIAICIFGTGSAISLSHDSRSVTYSMPVLFGQCILFWLLKGAEGYHIIVPLVAAMTLIIAAARASERSLNETIATRFENVELLQKLEREKEAAVEAARAAEEANRSKSMFMAAASHDLRQPLYAITLLAETLAYQRLEPPAGPIVEQQLRALVALRSMFDNLLDLSRFDSGDVRAKVEVVHLPELLSGMLEEFEPQCEAEGLTLDVEMLDDWVRSDRELLGRLLRNLLSNAVRYTDEGSIRLDVGVDGGDRIRFSVIDTGCGIEREQQDRIFEEFVQLSNPARSRTGGVGLGLSIVQRIARLLGHSVELSSEPGVGTRVDLRVERAAAPLPLSTEQVPASHGAHAASAQALPVVWIVEDDELVRDAMHAHLEAVGVPHRFGVCRADLEALAAEQGWPDHVVLDDMLGGHESGLELAHWLAEELPPDRIQMMTGSTDPDRLAVLGASPFEVLRKPVSSEQLLAWLGLAPAATRARAGGLSG